MKLGILTYHFAINYGAVLQVFALQETFKKLQIESQIINYVPDFHEKLYDIIEIKKSILLNKKTKPLKTILKYLFYILFHEKDYKNKVSKFKHFSKINLSLTNKITNYYELKDFNQEFTHIVCGSDQIWNPELSNNFDDSYFCKFCDSNIVKISYAASIGDINLLKNDILKINFLKLLNNFNHVSVRESNLSDFIINNSNTKSIVTLDPTLLLDQKEYCRIAIKSRIIKENYLLIYQLNINPKLAEIAKIVAKKFNLKIVTLMGNLFQNSIHTNLLKSIGPSEFVSLFRDASYIVTNSFHGTAFSIIFQKNFNIVLNDNRNDRMLNLLNNLNLENRIFYSGKGDYYTNSLDYTEPFKLLDKIKLQSLNYLKNSLSITNE